MAFKSNSRRWLTSEIQRINRVEEIMAGVILTRATILAPYMSGALKASGRVENNPDGGKSVIFGGNGVKYAKRRHYENKKNPQTLLYLEKSGDSVKREGIKKYYDMSR